MVRHVAVASILTALITAALFLTVLRPGPDVQIPAADSSSLWLRDLEDRLEALERRLNGAPAAEYRQPELPEASPGGGAVVEESDGAARAIADQISGLRSAVNDLAYRVQTLEEDPVNRGYAFLQSESPQLRQEGVKSLQRLARFDPAAREAIRRMLNDPHPRVRREAIDAVGELGDKEAIPLLADLLSDSEGEVRNEAIQSLAKLGAREAGPAIAALLSDPSDGIRQEAADALGRLRTREAVASLIEALADKNEEVRGEVIASLGEIGAREAVAPLRQLYYGSDPGSHRIRLIRALQSLGDEGPFNEEFKRLSDVALSGEDVRARSRSIQMLSWFARDKAQDVFKKLREDPNEWVRREAERALGRGGEGRREGPRRD